jgi:hypothetical protein
MMETGWPAMVPVMSVSAMKPCMHVGTLGSAKSPLAPASSGGLVGPSPDGVCSPASPDGVWVPPSLVPTPLLLLLAATTTTTTVRAQITPDAARRRSTIPACAHGGGAMTESQARGQAALERLIHRRGDGGANYTVTQRGSNPRASAGVLVGPSDGNDHDLVHVRAGELTLLSTVTSASGTTQYVDHYRKQ